MNRLYWHDQQVGYVCFVPIVWEQRGVIAAVADQTAMISHLLPMCWATRGRSWGHVMMWARFGSQGSIALNWHSRYSGTRYSGTWLYICVTKHSIGSDNGLLPDRRQAIIWTSAGILLIEALGTNFSEIFIEIHAFSFKEMHLKMSSGKWQPFCLSLNVLSLTKMLMQHAWRSNVGINVLGYILQYSMDIATQYVICNTSYYDVWVLLLNI